jgi:hypothetical protein
MGLVRHRKRSPNPSASPSDNSPNLDCGFPVGRAHRTGPMQILNSQRAKKAAQNNKYFEIVTTRASQFIADSSPICNDVGMHAHPCAARRATPSRGGDAKPRVSCEKGDGRAAERRSADTNLHRLFSASKPKATERTARFEVSSTPNKRAYLRGKPVTIGNYRLPAEL